MPPAEAARAAIRLVAVAGVVMDKYATCVELLQNATPLVAVPAVKSVTDVAEEATVVATAAGVAIGTGVLTTHGDVPCVTLPENGGGVVTTQGDVPWLTAGVFSTFTPSVGNGIGVGNAPVTEMVPTAVG